MPIRCSGSGRIPRHAVVLAITAISTSSGCHKPKPAPISVPPLGAVTLVPAVVYSGANRTFKWRAVVTTPSNRIIDVNGYPEITIKWSSTKAPSLFPDPAQNPVVVQVPNSPGLTIDDVIVTVTRELSPTDKSSITTGIAGSIKVASATSSATDRIVANYLPESPPVAVLLDAKSGVACPMNDWAIAVVEVADLDRNLDGGCSPAPELVAYSVGREILFRDQSSTFKWSPGFDEEEVNPPMPLFRSISVVIGVPTASELAWAAAEIGNANDLFDSNRSGIGLATAKTYVHGRTTGITNLAAACSTFALDALLLPGAHDMGDPDLFVLFVADLKVNTGSTELLYQGYTCPQSPGQTGRVVYLSLNSYLNTTLAHELGHIFGLIAGRIDFGDGHSNGIGTFMQDNLMYNTMDPGIRFNRDRFSMGQIFRMNFDSGSWLNNGGLDPSVVRKRTCQTAPGAGVCPALDKDPG